MDDRSALAALESRIKTLLPEQYQDCYEEVQPISMGSAGLKFGPDGKVAWNDMWATFCDLAMAGGPPHKGTLLGPATQSEIDAQPDRYQDVVREIRRGVAMVSDLPVHASPEPGWIRISCFNETMAQWLLRAVVMENVAVRSEGDALDLPAGPHFRLEKEIKNVVTVAAKTTHYWMGHVSRAQKQVIGTLFVTLGAESPLVEPGPSNTDVASDHTRSRMAEVIQRETGFAASSRRYAGWLGLECPNVNVAIWMMRALVASNVLSRREETTLFVPVNADHDPDGDRVVAAVSQTHRLAMLKSGLPQ